MVAKADWQTLARALRELHRALMLHAKLDYERDHALALNPSDLLRLLTTDAHFGWLRELSELMVEIDMIEDSEPPLRDEVAAAVREAVEHFIAVPAVVAKEPAAGNGFAAHYWPMVHDDPQVAMAHAGVKQVLAAWPLSNQPDAASRLHARHLLTEKARHAKRKT